MSSFDFTLFYDCEEEFENDRFLDCHEPPDQFHDCHEPLEREHPLSDIDTCLLPTTEPCRHMSRTFRTSRIPVMQQNRYAEWVRCNWCGVTHATMTYSSICCVRCKERYNNRVEDSRRRQQIPPSVHIRRPPMEAIAIARSCPWTKWGLLLSRFLFKMTPTYLNCYHHGR